MKKRRRVLQLFGVLTLLIALALVGVLWPRQTRWKTFVSMPLEPEGVALSVQLPEDWQQQAELPSGKRRNRDAVGFWFDKKPSGAIADAWRKWVVRQAKPRYILCDLRLRPISRKNSYRLMWQEFRYGVARKHPGSGLIFRAFQHPLGPAIQYDGTFTSQVNGHLLHERLLYVYPDDTPGHQKFVIECGFGCGPDQYEDAKPLFDQIASHICLMDRK